MDEESVGILGVLLIVTVLVMSQASMHKRFAAPALPEVKWADVIGVFGCSSQQSPAGCTLAMSQ